MTPTPSLVGRLGLLVGLFACAAAMALHAYPVARPMLYYDDFGILRASWTWRAAWDNLWVPQNEHAMPLGRLTTAALVEAVRRPAVLPRAAALQGPAAVLAGMGLLYLFVRRELGHPFYGLAAMSLFGVSALYQQAVHWFAASFSVLALDTLLAALLAAQRWRQTGRLRYLLLCALACALAPGWFASGILAGPLCCLYLLPDAWWGRDPKGSTAATLPSGSRLNGWFLIPLLGTFAFLAVGLPRTRERILHLEHYQGQTAVEAFRPTVGLWYTCRSVADNLTLGVIGVTGLGFPAVLAPVVVGGAIGLTVWWWRPVRPRRLLYLGLGLILFSYLLVYSARSYWDYDSYGMSGPAWSRYHLLPQLGLALIIAGGLPRWQGVYCSLAPSGELSRGQAAALGVLLVFLFVPQLPRALLAAPPCDPGQGQALRRIEEMEARCRRHGIDGETARGTLPPLDVPGTGQGENGWWMLRGSPQPRAVTEQEARRLLETD